VLAVAAATAGAVANFRGRLAGLRLLRTRRRGFTLVQGRLEDGTGSLPVVWFNRPYLARQVAAREGEWLLYGEVRAARSGDGALELLNPTCEAAERAVHGARVAPVYPAAGGLGPAVLRRLLDGVLAAVDLERLADPLPPELLARHRLPPLGAALAALHRPAPDADVAALNARTSPAHRRLVYGELLELQLRLALLRERAARRPRTLCYLPGDRLLQAAREVLPFRLTAAQERALAEILADLGGPSPMLRLLQGEVGSGKTIVAALALVAALESGFQGAFMAPTELLAEQHFANLERLLGTRYRLGLFTSASGASLRERLAAGDVQLAVGTHALLEERVEFRRLGLAVVDEQHRFGVLQRGLLRGKGERPDLLVMTATPIPRSLALAAYGDLPVSVLDELPPGRTPVATEVVPERRRAEVYRRLREELAAGGRAYVVFPRIGEGDEEEAGAVSLAATGEEARAALAGFPSAVLHGRMPAADRERAMRAFAAGEVRVLVATTVVEVGVDVPEATWMVIEGAERFGLAQLHQLRGRVGRGERPSRCVALHGRLTEAARRRLEVFRATTDGFAIAEADLALRGPGDLLGTRQAGLPALRVADLAAHYDWLLRARDDARELLARLGEPELAALAERIEGAGEPVLPD
jgi:ATP-dependent DNA helicase RecG